MSDDGNKANQNSVHQKNDNKNIILIGMLACGKSTIGVNLAKLAGYDFVDSDLLIQKRKGKLLRELIREEGVDGFIAIENKVNRSIEVRHSVIATGGEQRRLRTGGDGAF